MRARRRLMGWRIVPHWCVFRSFCSNAWECNNINVVVVVIIIIIIIIIFINEIRIRNLSVFIPLEKLVIYLVRGKKGPPVALSRPFQKLLDLAKAPPVPTVPGVPKKKLTRFL